MIMDAYVVYDQATGEERWRGKGDASIQEVPPGLAAMAVPLASLSSASVDIDIIKLAYCSLVDAAAEKVRLRFITPGDGQSMTYLYKALEVQRWYADNTADVPFIAKEAAGLGVSVAERMAVVKARVDAWTVIGSDINDAQQCAKDRVMNATSIGAIAALPPVDWEAVVGG